MRIGLDASFTLIPPPPTQVTQACATSDLPFNRRVSWWRGDTEPSLHPQPFSWGRDGTNQQLLTVEENRGRSTQHCLIEGVDRCQRKPLNVSHACLLGHAQIPPFNCVAATAKTHKTAASSSSSSSCSSSYEPLFALAFEPS
ncbi:unnamed protein product [Hydatigera taeniaeformis]|uniref:Ig-like domain-containing protein n=1 Tax=Hydatigena taeniaeformis TaxID=6205 RepID=A0A0R3X1E2_HYDTA|nr:unnamed protein product [Hydatigera taeniaeformis]